MGSVAIVILNYNGKKYLQQFLSNVVGHSQGYDVWVADNASTDGSVEWVQSFHPEVKLLAMPTNEGYAGGYNRALSQIKADYYVLLNSDVEVTENWIAPVISFMDSDPEIAACQPKIRAYDLRDHFEYAGAAGGYVDWLGYPFCRGRIFDTREKDLGQYDDIQDVFWATGACLFIRSSDFFQADGFDENFFAHMEEIDLCWRLKKQGKRICYFGQATVFHVGGGTLHKSNPRKTFLNYRNNLLMLHKNLPAQNKKRTLFLRLVLDGISSVRFIMSGSFPDVVAIIKAHFAFYRMARLYTPGKNKTSRTELYSKSVVWEYFALSRHTFDKLKGKF